MNLPVFSDIIWFVSLTDTEQILYKFLVYEASFKISTDVLIPKSRKVLNIDLNICPNNLFLEELPNLSLSEFDFVINSFHGFENQKISIVRILAVQVLFAQVHPLLPLFAHFLKC